MPKSHSIIGLEDESGFAYLFKEFLINDGYEVVSFTVPVLALEHYKETTVKPSEIINDLRMPSICGRDLE